MTNQQPKAALFPYPATSRPACSSSARTTRRENLKTLMNGRQTRNHHAGNRTLADFVGGRFAGKAEAGLEICRQSVSQM